MEILFSNYSKDYKTIFETIESFNTLKLKLQYYNDNYRPLIVTNNEIPNHKVHIQQIENSTIFCLCNDCRNKYSISDFEVYRDFVNSQTDKIAKYFSNTTNDYKTKLEYYYFLNGGYASKSFLILKYIPKTIDEVKDFYGYKETIIDITPQTQTEFKTLIEFLKAKIINDENNKNHSKVKGYKGTDIFNPSIFTYEYRVAEISNFLELIVDEADRKDLIKKYLDKINLDKIDTDKINQKIQWSNEVYNLNILTIANEIIQKKEVEAIVDKQNLKEVEIYLLALETIKFKKYLNSLLVANSQQIINAGINSVQNILNSKKQEMYVSPLSFSIYTQPSKEYILEFTQKESLITKLILEYELEMYRFYKEIAHYKFNGKNYKNPLSQEYYDNLEIEAQIFEGCNIKVIYDNCFEIVEFLESKSSPLNYHPQLIHNPQTTIDFFKLVNQSLVSELDIFNFIERVTNNDPFKLEILAKDIQTFETDFICSEIVESWFADRVYNPKSVSELFKRFKEIVSEQINKLPQKTNNSNPAYSIFIDSTTTDNFNLYLKLHIVEPYVDLSYLFQRLTKENLIIKIKHLDFVNWLFDNSHINESTKDLIIKNNGFRSLAKSFSTQRENNFNNIFNL
ncbi:hypothetical protein [Flavobacterium wongokense]|uniref:hypothetical protein n=1 Tax=Flavobacterium wongokense TaxID=2910674 RepID=UPI001F2DC3FA|nr:hypothetical protein [Flavobacterium sp. WG47]MCF6131102.1 hypothetical protein [Flavobacterium sp. WG47]